MLRALFALVCAARHLCIVFSEETKTRGFGNSGIIDRLYEVEKNLDEVLADNPASQVPVICNTPMAAGPRHCLRMLGHKGEHSCQ